jgi:hypothetical protein
VRNFSDKPTLTESDWLSNNGVARLRGSPRKSTG